MENFKKVVRPGDRIFCQIKLNEGCLSITGVDRPRSNGDADSCGQIRDFEVQTLAPGWTKDSVKLFQALWEEWHLNDLQAGTPEQMAHLKLLTFPGHPLSHYNWAKEQLAPVGLEPHNGYSYGSAWLRVEVPEHVLQWLRNLPDTDITPAWV